MRNSIICLLLAGSLFILAACTSLRRYNSVAKAGIDNDLADVSLFGSTLKQAAPGKEGKNLWDLSADAQSQLIKILNLRYPDNKDFINSLSFGYLEGDEQLLVRDFAHKDLRLVFSLSKMRDYSKTNSFQRSRLSSADRIEYIKISLVLKEPGTRFTNWNMYSTEYGSIDIGDVSFTRSLDITGSVSSSGKKEGPGGEISGEASLSRKEEQALKYRYIKINGRLNESGIEMEEEGTREIDLTGNIIADVSIEFDRTIEVLTRITGLKDSSGEFNSPEKLSVDNYMVAVPDFENIISEIQADLKLDFIYRNVKQGRKTFPEWDDRIEYYKGHRESTVPLFKDSDYVPGFCCIGSGQGGTRKEFVSLDSGNDTAYPMIFSTYEEASLFNIWLMDRLRKNEGKPVKIGGRLLKYKSADLSSGQINNDSGFGIVTYYW
jgi:hypothetical protein